MNDERTSDVTRSNGTNNMKTYGNHQFLRPDNNLGLSSFLCSLSERRNRELQIVSVISPSLLRQRLS